MLRLSAAFRQCLIWLVVVGCEKHSAPDAAHSTAGGNSRPPSSVVVDDGASKTAEVGPGDSPVTIARAGIDTTITLGDWLKSHPGDSVTAKSLRHNNALSCRVAIARSTFANRRIIRYAGFHVLVPEGEQLPQDTTRIAERVCHLREIYLETEFMDSAAAGALLDSIGGQLWIAESRMRANEGATAGYGWANGKTRRTNGTAVVMAIAPPPELPSPSDSRAESPLAADDSLSRRLASPRKLVMTAWAPGSVFQDHSSWGARDNDMHYVGESNGALPPADVDSAIVWVGLSSVAADLNVMLAELRKPARRSLTADSALIRAFRTIRDTAPSLEPPRRAAALLAAELVRYAFMPVLQFNADAQDRALYETLHKIIHGPTAEFSHDTDAFNRAWLWEAYRLDSTGRAGHLAFVRLLQSGFRRDAVCAEDVGFYTAMITRGEAHLRRGNTDPLVHFFVGAAHKSIFELANTAPGDYVEQVPTRSEGEAARLRAIHHFRAALTGLRDRSMRREAWYYATMLLLGKTGRAWFFCISEDD